MADERRPLVDPEELAARAYDAAHERGATQEEKDAVFQRTFDASQRAMSRPVASALNSVGSAAVEKAKQYYEKPSRIADDIRSARDSAGEFAAQMLWPMGGSGLAGSVLSAPGFYFNSTVPANAGERDYVKDNIAAKMREEQGRSSGGRTLEDKYPTHYFPHVGRQVAASMSKGGTPPNTIDRAMAALPQRQDPVSLARNVLANSPTLENTFRQENQTGVIVSPRPGKGGGPPIVPEKGVDYDPSLHGEREPWSYATPDLLGAALPPPVQHPVLNEPRMDRITKATQGIFKKKEFQNLVKDMTGLEGLKVMPTVGTWMGEKEPSFIIQHPDMTPEHAEKIAHLLGFGFQQDAVVHNKHNPDLTEGIPNLLIGSKAKLSANKIDEIADLAKKSGLDFTVTGDGKAAKFMHFGGDEEFDHFLDKVTHIADAAGLPERYHARSTGDLINAEAYLPKLFGSQGGGERLPTGAGRSPDLFRRIVDHVLTPYAKAVAGEGYRLSPERLQEAYGLTDDETNHVRQSLYPTGKKTEDRTTIPLMTGDETLDVRPTGANGKASVSDVLYALQNRAAEKGQIDPGDFSDTAKNKIANDIAKEVAYHVANSDKSAIGWYDDALKKAMGMYGDHFQELSQNPDNQMLFHALLGITSQGNDVYSNSIHATRLYKLMQDKGIELPEAVKQLKGTFGDKTRAIETNLLKFHDLLDKNGFDKLRDKMNQTKTVSEWNKELRTNPDLKVGGGEPLSMQGGKDQKVTGWMVFGPKIGSFINNLHGDYSTLTADLWFSRTWNRLLGHNFIHSPMAEAKQYRDLRDAMKAEWNEHNSGLYGEKTPKTVDGKIKQGAAWLHGDDLKGMPQEDFDQLINDPDAVLNFAQDVTKKYKDSQYKAKSDVRRRAKNWIENRELPVAAPRGDLERNFQQNTVEQAQKLLRKKYGMDISIADIQAALWFHEKELFGKLGVASEKAQPADYADAAQYAISRINDGTLYQNKTREKPKKKSKEQDFV